jgi:antitoxin ParD1/3/4
MVGCVIREGLSMPTTFVLDQHFETFVQAQLETGRYSDADAVLRDALRMLEDRERKLGALDVRIARGLADIDAGRVHDLESVFDEVDAELAALPGNQAE